jgi:5-hydroxyisourate hydrolase-like protein (transthyretin family)
MAILVRVIDGMHGRAAEGVTVKLGRQADGRWQNLTIEQTDKQRRCGEWFAPQQPPQGVYRVEVDVDAYFAALGITPFLPKVTVDFRIINPGQNITIPVVITPYLSMAYRQGGPIDW